MQLVVDFEITSGNNLKDCISVVFKVQNVIISLVFGFDISEALGCEKTKIVVFFFVTLYQNTLSEP